MRFIRTRPSGQDKDIPVFEFAFGVEELKLLLGICKTTKKYLPDVPDRFIMRSRLYNITKILQKTWNEYNEK